MDPYLLLAAAEDCAPGLCPALLDPDADPEALLRSPPGDLPPALRRRLEAADDLARRARAWQDAASAHGCRVVTPRHDAYPEHLARAPLRPLALFAKGDVGLLAAGRRAVTVVGSRTPTAYGEAAAADFGEALARAGVPLWSGLAAGIDAEAHRACLRTGTPTVAVLAGGLDRIYPAQHAALAGEIVARRGLLLSELPPGRRPTRGHFPRRNRILALATAAVLVVEAGLASGSLHTARFAADAGILVFAVPGSYSSPRSRGCHRLIEDGAEIASDPEDLLRALGVTARAAPDPAGRPDATRLEATADELAILRQLEAGPRPSDLVERESRLCGDRYLKALIDLLERRRIVQLAGDLLAVGPGRR